MNMKAERDWTVWHCSAWLGFSRDSTSMTGRNLDVRRPPSFETPYYVRALAMGFSAYLIGVHLWTWIFMFSVMAGGRADFRQLYTAGYMARSGHAAELYDYNSQTRFQNAVVSEADVTLPFNHLAYESLLFAPLSLLSYKR